MYKAIKHHLQGAVAGSLITLAAVGFIVAPHVEYNVHATNQAAAQVVAQDQSVAIAQLMPSVAPIPSHKPLVH